MGICGGDGFGLDTSNTFCKVKFVLQCLRMMTLCGLEGDKENLGGNAIVKFEH